MARFSVKRDLERHQQLKAEKQPWLRHYQALAEMFFNRKSDFINNHTPGDFLNEEIFDNTGQFAAYLMASTFLSMLWPDSARTFNLVAPRQLEGLKGVEEFHRFMTDETHQVMDSEQAGLDMSFMEYFLDIGVFGTAGVATFEGPKEDDDTPVLYEAWDIKGMSIAQNAQGFVDTVYFVIPMTVRQIVQKYGPNVSPKIMELFRAAGKQDEKIDVLKILEPKDAEKGKKGTAGMPTRSAVIDIKHKFNMSEKGFEEMPVAVGRMFKRIDETIGRSSGMVALPPMLSLNALTEAIIVAVEKQLDPPLAILDDGRLGGAKINTSAGSLSVLNVSGRLGNEKPLFQIQTVGEIQSAKELKEQFIQEITQAFFLDRLLDLNNKTQMTAFETSIRNRLRGESLGSIFSRQIKEVISPTIRRTVNILWRRGRFGNIETGPSAKRRQAWQRITGKSAAKIPQVILDAAEAGLEVYEIEYISPAKRFMQAEKLQGIFTAADAAAALQPVLPGITDGIDPDLLLKDIYKFSGAPNTSLRTKDGLEAFRKTIAEREEGQTTLETAKQVSEIKRNVAQADATRAALGTVNGGGR